MSAEKILLTHTSLGDISPVIEDEADGLGDLHVTFGRITAEATG